MKIDLHIHSHHSYDSLSSLEKIAKTIAQKGLHGFAITDHDTTAGWKEARRAAKKYKLLFVPGEEIKTKKNGRVVGDIIGIFLKKEIKAREPKKVIEEIKKQGGIAIIPHPFHVLTPFRGDIDEKSFKLVTPFRGNIENFKNLVDAIEVFNARVPLKSSDIKALFFARENNISEVAGSDAHYWKDAGDAYTIAQKAKTPEDFKEAILNKKTRASGKKSPLRSLTSPSLARFRINHRAQKTKYLSFEEIKDRIKKYSTKKNNNI